jgi:hypothetical protein
VSNLWVKIKDWLLVIMSIYSLVVSLILYNHTKPVIVNTTVIDTNDSLLTVIDSLTEANQSLKEKRESVKVEIVKYEKLYIDTGSLDSDIKFFSDYLSTNN